MKLLSRRNSLIGVALVFFFSKIHRSQKCDRSVNIILCHPACSLYTTPSPHFDHYFSSLSTIFLSIVTSVERSLFCLSCIRLMPLPYRSLPKIVDLRVIQTQRVTRKETRYNSTPETPLALSLIHLIHVPNDLPPLGPRRVVCDTRPVVWKSWK